MKEEFPAVFKGPKTATIKQCKIEDGKLWWLERNPLFPFRKRWVPIGGNLTEKMKRYEERPHYDPSDGEIGDDIRFYPFGLEDLKDDFTQINETIMHELESTKAELEHYQRMTISLMQIAEDRGLIDLFKKAMIDDQQFLNQARPTQFVTSPKETVKKKK